MGKKLDHALGLYMDGIRDGHVREAVERYTGERYTQHSTGVADGVEGFVAFFEPFIERTSERDIQVRRTVEDGPYVFCHVSQSLNGGDARWITTDLFDTDENDKIIEHWDVIGEWKDEGDVAGPSEMVDLDRTEANKEAVKTLVEDALIGGDASAAKALIADDLIQHEWGVEGGRDAWLQHLNREEAPTRYRRVARLIGQGNFVVTYCEVLRGADPYAVFDIYRLANGKVVERWVNAEIVPEDTGNSGKF